MSSLAVWMTSDEARIFTFDPSGPEAKHVSRHGKKHQREVQGKNRPQQGGDADRFYHKLASELAATRATRWLVIGPGLAKTHFAEHVRAHHPRDASKILAVETLDRATDGEIKNFAHDCFKRHGVFEPV